MQIVEAEKKAASAITKGTSKALDNIVVNDEEVNRLRGAFEEHMQNYQKRYGSVPRIF